jgi:prepilin-type N-terminal cleavage/methylation domain-containing protein/prepilin-type processing-associated H-X9-DG protein
LKEFCKHVPEEILMTRRGFTLIELLIVIAIISLLLQMALPAIEASREAARRTQCMNNLKQVALAFQTHEATHGYFPTSGWGRGWMGLPDRGFGLKQPGGWVYNILPFIEQQQVRDLGAGLKPASDEQREALLKVAETALPLFNCPSRRLLTLYPFVDDFIPRYLPQRCGQEPFPCRVARSDYAANAGNIYHFVHRATGPKTLKGGDGPWKPEWIYGGPEGKTALTGISYQRSMVRLAEITDGASNTYCIGEKYVPIPFYKTGEWYSDNGTMFLGQDYDVNRWSGDQVEVDSPLVTPSRDSESEMLMAAFGSAHPSGFQMAFCDGSVQLISYDGDAKVHLLRGGRNDDEMEQHRQP